jgi:Tol biopolymer transport system component
MQLTEAPLYPIVLRWSPDGTQILFMGQDSEGHSKGYIISAQGGAPRPIRPEDTGSQNDPNWSPDGRKIVFSTLDFNKPAADIAIRVLDLATHQVTTLPGSDDTGFPRWSPNGRFIAALTYSSRDLKVFDFETQRWSVLQEGETGFPEWSRDGKFIYFLRPRGNSGVYRIRPSGGDAERIVDLKGFRYTGAVSFWMGLDPEDTPLLLRDTGRSEIYALTLEEK